MEQQSRGDFRLSGMTQDAFIKSSSEASSSLMPPSQHLVPPMLPSLDAYLDAYRSLMSQDVQAMSALGGCGLGIRPPGLTMPVLPTAAAAAAAAASLVSSPYYGLSPYSVDLARYGLLSPVYVPPFIAPLLCGGAGGVPGLLPTAEPTQASPGASRSSTDRDVPAYPPQSFSKSLLEACAAARKNDCTVTAAGAPGRPKQSDTRSKPSLHDPHHVERNKPIPLASSRTVASTDLMASERKWNSGKVDRADVPPQSATAVDFSTRLTSDVSLKSSVAGSALSSDNWKFTSASATAPAARKNAVDNSTHAYGALSKPVALQCAGEQKKSDKVDSGSVKAVRNGELEREAGVQAVVDSRITSIVSGDKPKHKVTVSQNDETKISHQSDAVSAMCRVTSSGLSESGTTTDTSLGSRRPARPGAKKRPAELGVALPAGSDLASPGDTDAKSRSGGVEEFRCRLCNYSGRSQHCLSKHYRAHDLAYKICRYCRRAFERPSDLLRHEERHRRRDVLGSGGTGDASSDTAVSCSTSDVAHQPAVGRIDSYADGVVASTCLVSAGLGPGDNEVILCFDEPAAEALVDQPTAPPPSKLRDVYSIMAGIFVNQQFFSFGQSPPVVCGSEQATPRSGVDDHGGTLVPDFGQQAFLQMLDLKMVSDSGSSSVAPAFGSGTGHVSPRGAMTPVAATGGGRERRRKGVPNRAVTHDTADIGASGVNDGSSDALDTAKVRCGSDTDEFSPAFAGCNGVVAGKSMKLAPEDDSVKLPGYPRDSSSCGTETATSAGPHNKLLSRRRSRKFFYISCKVCSKRLLQGSELGRHWRRHSVQDADGCYSCAACSFTSNVRLIMHSHAHVHLIRHRSTMSHSTSAHRCRLCGKPRRQTQSAKRDGMKPVRKTANDGGLVRCLWCSECSRRLATSRLLKVASLRRNNTLPLKSVRRRLGRRLARDATVSRTESHKACQSCV